MNASGMLEGFDQDSFGLVYGIYDITGDYIQGSKYGIPIQPDMQHGYHQTTKQYDLRTNMYDFNFRLYDPVIGRFIQQEPLGIDGPNPYHFTFNNPVNSFDPNGLQSSDAPGSEEEVNGYIDIPSSPHPMTDFDRFHYAFGTFLFRAFDLYDRIFNPSISISNQGFFVEWGIGLHSVTAMNIVTECGGLSIDITSNRHRSGLLEIGPAFRLPIGLLSLIGIPIPPTTTVGVDVGIDIVHGGPIIETPINIHIDASVIRIPSPLYAKLKILGYDFEAGKPTGILVGKPKK